MFAFFVSNPSRTIAQKDHLISLTQPAFYNTLCCQQATVAKTCCASFVAFDSAEMSRHRLAKSQVKAGSYRLDRHGNPPCFSILHRTLQTPSGPLQTTISKIYGYLRYFQSSVAWNGYRPRSKTRLCRRRIYAIERTFTAKVRNNFSRCWLRIRAFSQTLSRSVEHTKYHPNYATRSTTPRWQTQSSHRTLSKTYAKQFSKEHLWPTLADRNGFQYAQTQSWQRPSCKKSSQPDSRNPSSCTNPQPDDSQAYNLCSIQSNMHPYSRITNFALAKSPLRPYNVHFDGRIEVRYSLYLAPKFIWGFVQPSPAPSIENQVSRIEYV